MGAVDVNRPLRVILARNKFLIKDKQISSSTSLTRFGKHDGHYSPRQKL